ncbi:putative DXD-containing glycosyltransferase [Yasminevirus sp. GU-2018]|uniref:Putative DXD-containing glycosyltransferase n=1 Tax=Yasminevirus sp. GU-2018 TaxID=2420051 RepID=A0A5K0UBP7_9VIRU|nr:putative DXD-containing glycosyltransferase [Yasminevirus sp. GU-2018]
MTKFASFIIILSMLLLCIVVSEYFTSSESNIERKIDDVTEGMTTDQISDALKNKPYMWVYWELINGATKPPDYITLCLDIIRKNGSRYFEVVFLNEKNVFDYIPDLRKDINTLPIALKTDYIRVKLLHMYGGLWIDADTILMNNMRDIALKLNSGVDFIGFGCTGRSCKDQEGYGRPSNGVMGSIKRGKLISRCLNALDLKLNEFYSIPVDKRKEFNYFELGKLIIWDEYKQLMSIDPTYKMYHVPSYSDGTRDAYGRWVALEVIFDKHIEYSHPDKLLVVMLANSNYCGKDPKYNWFCKLTRAQVMRGDYFVSKLFRRAMQYNPYKDNNKKY